MRPHFSIPVLFSDQRGRHCMKSIESMASPLTYLLPCPLPQGSEEDHDTTGNLSSWSTNRDNDEMLELYRQAVPLVQPHSTAAIKTLGTIVRDRELVKRMLQRPQPYAKQLDRRPPLNERCASVSTTFLTRPLCDQHESLAQVHESDTLSSKVYARKLPQRTSSLHFSASAPALLHAKLCSHTKRDPVTLAAVTKLKDDKRLQRQAQTQADELLRRAKQESAEVTRVFSASVAMISRHVHTERVRECHQTEHGKQIARTDHTRYWSHVHRAHCQAIEEDVREQRARELRAMKALTEEELLLSRNFRSLREEMARRNKPLFALSPSTSTIFPPPPEILAAQTIANSSADLKRLALAKREYVEHMRSLQLLDYACDRRRRLADTLQPRAASSLIEVDVPDEQLPADRVVQLAGDEIWRQLVQQQQEGDPDSLAKFVPPSNVPPAALRYFGTSRPISMPAFASTVDRNLQ